MPQTNHEAVNVVTDLVKVDVVNLGRRDEGFHHGSAASYTGRTGKTGLIGIAATIGQHFTLKHTFVKPQCKTWLNHRNQDQALGHQRTAEPPPQK